MLGNSFFCELGCPLHCQLLLFLLLFLGDLFQFTSSLLLFHDHEVLEETVAQMFTHFLIRRLSELIIGVFVIEVPVEASFKSETVHDVVFAPHDDTCGLQL